jgi:hypothetical protein
MSNRAVGDIVLGLANADQQNYICVLTDIDFTPPGKLDSFDVGVCLKGRLLGSRIRLDRVRVITSSAELLRLAEETGRFDFSTPPEVPDHLLSEAELAKRENQKLLKRLEALEEKLAAKS